MKTSPVRLVMLLAPLLLASCTTVQTTYFRGSYQPLANATNPAFIPYNGTSEFMMVEDMSGGALDMYGRGYALLGYSQFISPLFTNLAPGYATKFAATLNAAHAVLETPRPGASNLHGYLATYWAKVRPEQFTLGAYHEDLPAYLLERLGKNYNVVVLRQIVPGTPAAGAGFKANDAVLAVNGVRVESAEAFGKLLDQNQGQEVIIRASRQGELQELPVTLAVPVRKANAAVGFQEAPWENTKPTDWSLLSAANITVDVMRQQQAERERQAAYERGRLAAMEARQSLDSGSAVRSGGGAISRDMRASGQSGRYTREMRARGIAPPPPSQEQWELDFRGALDAHQKLMASLGRSLERDRVRQTNQTMDIWVSNAPNIYSQLFTFPRPKPM